MTRRELTKGEFEALPWYEQKVILHYMKTRKVPFYRDELISLKKCIMAATPAQINALIDRFHKTYPDNFTDFHYLVKPVTQMFKNRRGKQAQKKG